MSGEYDEDYIPTIDEKSRNYTDELIKALETGKNEKGKDALKNLHVATSKLYPSDVELVIDKLKLMDYCITNCYRVKPKITPFETVSMELERTQILANLRKAERGFFAELLLKHHQVIQNMKSSEEKKKTWLQKLFGL